MCGIHLLAPSPTNKAVTSVEHKDACRGRNNSPATSQRTQSVLMLFIVSHTEHTNTLWGQNEHFLTIRATAVLSHCSWCMCLSVGTQMQSVVLRTGRSTGATVVSGVQRWRFCMRPAQRTEGWVPCWRVNRYESFGAASRLHLQGTESQPYYAHDVRTSKFKKSYRVFLLSYPRVWEFYCIESLYQLAHPMKTSALWERWNRRCVPWHGTRQK